MLDNKIEKKNINILIQDYWQFILCIKCWLNLQILEFRSLKTNKWREKKENKNNIMVLKNMCLPKNCKQFMQLYTYKTIKVWAWSVYKCSSFIKHPKLQVQKYIHQIYFLFVCLSGNKKFQSKKDEMKSISSLFSF